MTGGSRISILEGSACLSSGEKFEGERLGTQKRERSDRAAQILNVFWSLLAVLLRESLLSQLTSLVRL